MYIRFLSIIDKLYHDLSMFFFLYPLSSRYAPIFKLGWNLVRLPEEGLVLLNS